MEQETKATPAVGVPEHHKEEAPKSKSKNTKLFLILGALGLVAIIGSYLWSQQGKQTTQGNKVVKIGIIAPLSGESASDGQLIERGADMARKEFSQEGLTIQLVTRDTLCDPEKAAAAVRDLVDTENVMAIIGENCSSATLGAMPAADEKGVVLISPASSSPLLTKANDYFFRTFPSDNLQGVVTAKLMRENNLSKLAIIHSNEAYGNGLDASIKENFQKLGGTIVASESFEREAVNFQTQLQKIKNANPDVLYIVSNAKNSAAAILLAIKKIGLKVPLYASESVKDQQVLDDVGDVADGMIFTSVTEGNPIFIDKYRAAYGAAPASSNAAQSYDAFMALAQTIQQGAMTREQIKDALYNVSFDGASGPIKFDETGDLASGNYKIYTVKDGTFVLVNQ